MSLPPVLFSLKVPAEHFSPLDGLAEIRMLDNGVAKASREQILREVNDCAGFISQGEVAVDAELLDAAPHLKIVANVAMGVDNLDLDEIRSRGIAAVNTPSAFAESTADLTLGLMLDLTRRISESDRHVRTGEWAKGMEPLRWEGTKLGELTLGIVGYGRIAKLVESRAVAFGMDVIHCRSRFSGGKNERTLDDLLAEADIVVTLVPLTPDTHHLINVDRLAKMKPGSFFLNVARGKVMDESAVVEALQSGHLAGAAFDVFEEEPIVSEELFAMENVVLTSHIGGATRQQRRSGRLEAAADVARFLRGEELRNGL